MVLLAGYIFLKEKISKIEMYNIFFSFTVALFLIIISNKDSPVKESSSLVFALAVVGMFLGILFDTLSVVCVRVVKDVHCSNLNTVFGYFLTVVSFIIWIVYYINKGPDFSYNFSVEDWIYIAFLSLVVGISNLLYTISY